MLPDLKTSPKREIGKSCIIFKTPDNEWTWVKTNHLSSASKGSLTLVNYTNGTNNFGRFGKNGKHVIPRKVLLFSGKFLPG